MDVYIGFDISLQSTHICVVDESGLLVREGVALSEAPALDSWLKQHGRDWTIRRIVFETGQLSAFLYHGLRPAWPVICIDARHAHGTLKAQRVKNDKNDARGLAQIARTGWYKAVHIKSEECQGLRTLVACRKHLVMTRLSMENHIRGMLKALGIKLGVVTTAAFSAKVKASIEGKDALFAHVMSTMLAARDQLLKQQQSLDKRCGAIARSNPICKRLMTVPGVGIITALSYRAEIDDPHRFKKSRDVGVHLGLTPKRYASGETDRSGGISKCGNGALRTLLFEASVTMLTRSGKWSRLKAWGIRLAQRNGFKAASVALARKLAVVMHRMWMDETEFAYGEPPAMLAA
jgi:transposase